MIGRITGKLLEKQAPYLLIDVNGVAYELQAPMTSFYPLPDIGEEVILHTHLSVSENLHQLFGFYSLDERLLFRTLIKVSGVGPKMALAILSGMSADDFVQCVRGDNITALVKLPGVGKKTAERLIIEVKDRLKDWKTEHRSNADATTKVPLHQPSTPALNVIADAESALVALGYKPAQAAQMIAAVDPVLLAADSEGLSSEQIIRSALKRAAG